MVLKLIFSLFLAAGAHAEVKSLSLSDLDTLTPLGSQETLHRPSAKDKILYFWATWCPDCKDKLTSVFKDTALYEKYDVYLVATDKDSEKIQHYQKKNAIENRIFLDEDRSLQKKLGVFSVPTIVRLKATEKNLTVASQQSGGDIQTILKESNP